MSCHLPEVRDLNRLTSNQHGQIDVIYFIACKGCHSLDVTPSLPKRMTSRKLNETSRPIRAHSVRTGANSPLLLANMRKK